MSLQDFVEEYLPVLRSRWRVFWYQAVPQKQITRFRIVHGFAFLLFLTWGAYFAKSSFTDSDYHLFSTAVPLLPAWALSYFAGAQFVAAILFLFGYSVRMTAFISWILLLYASLADRINSFSIHSIFLFTLLIFSLFNTQGKAAVAPVRLLQLFVVSIYMGAGWSKMIHGDWFVESDTLTTILSGHYMTNFSAWMIRSLSAEVLTATQYFVVAFELFSPVLFLTRSLVPIGVAIGGLLHAGISFCMADLGVFSLLMVSFYLLFASPLLPRPEHDNE